MTPSNDNNPDGGWRAETKAIAPLRKNKEKVRPSALRHRDVPSVPEKDPVMLPPPIIRSGQHTELTPGSADGVDRNTAARLRRGALPVEARLDLHGMTQEEAQPRLQRFLEQAYRDNLRCVLVITGKGIATNSSRGVLREMLPRWLNESSIRPYVLMFAPAKPKDGGIGAFYILVRRKRLDQNT